VQDSRENIQISILLPSRHRPDSLFRLFKSINSTAFALSYLEVLVYLDNDDELTKEEHFVQFSFVKFFRGPRVWMSLAQNFLYMNSKGGILMAASDDFIFRTPHWDSKVRDEFSRTEGKPLLLFGNDMGKYAGKLSTHFFLNRTWPEKLGYWVPVQRNGLWDLWIYELASGLSCIRYDKELIFEHAHFRHSSNHLYSNKIDAVSLEILQSQELVKPSRTYKLLERERIIDLLLLMSPSEDITLPKIRFLLSRTFLVLFGKRLTQSRRQKIIIRSNYEFLLDSLQFLASKVNGLLFKERKQL